MNRKPSNPLIGIKRYIAMVDNKRESVFIMDKNKKSPSGKTDFPMFVWEAVVFMFTLLS